MVLAGAWAADLAVVQPKELAGQLAGHRATIVVLQVGPNVLYRSKHIPGAIYAGPANRPEGLEVLKAAAAKLPRDREIVLYCGCCPWDHCPNIRPALELMRQMASRTCGRFMCRTISRRIGLTRGIRWNKGSPAVPD